MDTEPAIIITEPDWKAIQASYLQGHPLATIAANHGCTINAVRTKAHRSGWPTLRQQALTIARQEVSDEIRSCLVDTILKDVRGWRDIEYPAKVTEDYERLVRSRERVVATASKLLGWELDTTAAGNAADTWDSRVIELAPSKHLANE